ncbi:UDP-N-acetylmuramoylalanine--D-glutamate ligase [Bifidobacterium sp. GSD1FS]|uniref:UDP-N-acetylmuramoylalanine--D-glutamate ligase n=2 Tax=Bifidobacterium canis TaxID=2610880 RepID=A0A7K1J2C7_9BIFI|nr:UDP-N-acetylmuramoylalanine--D-glutamate ligase [Bifidobacterium canis]
MSRHGFDVQGKTVVVAGLGISGRSMAKILKDHGATVIGVDEKQKDADLHSFDEIDWSGVDLVCTSPVFNPRTPFIVEAGKRGIEVISEVELAWRMRVDNARTGRPAPWIGITGTNGKTSTTEMTSEMLRACGYDAPAVGNIGKAVSQAALDPSHDVLCVELSSFQLHFTYSLELACAAITNIAADHLDWHGGMENYAADKAKVYDNASGVIAYNAQDKRVTTLAQTARTAEGCEHIGFTLGEPQSGQIGIKDGWIVDMSGLTGGEVGEEYAVAPIREFKYLAEPDGTIYPHLLADALTALILVLGIGADLNTALNALKEFEPGGHRIQKVAELKQGEAPSIRFIDDSKATNAHAARASLSSFPDGSVVWIAGGLAKGATFEDLVAQERGKIKAAVVIGVDQQPMIDALRVSAPDLPFTLIDPSGNETVMQRTVDAAGALAQPGDVVLLAPACASMDQFKSYADRGDQFAKQAQRWVEAHAKA